MNQNLAIPAAIVIAGILIAASLFFAGRVATPTVNNVDGGDTTAGNPKDVPAVTADDHILGNPDAPIVIIEYSDIECPFCKQFHLTMKQIMEEYGQSGKVAWVYRNFPLQQLHPNAPQLAEAGECVAKLGGNDAYWSFLDELFTIAPINTLFPMDRLNEAVASVGVDTKAFETCVASGEMQAKVEQHFNDAVATGGQGTPHNIVITKAGSIVPVPGAQPYNQMKTVIDTILQEEKY